MKIERTPLAQDEFDIAIYAAAVEAAAKTTDCNERFTMPVPQEMRDAITRNLAIWWQHGGHR